MPKPMLAIYLVASLVDVSLALQVQQKTDLANLRMDSATTELEWVWTQGDGVDTCDSACANVCAGAVCSTLDMGEIDTCAKMTDLESEMGTSECGECSSSVSWGPAAWLGYCFPFESATDEVIACSDNMAAGYKTLCACEITLGTCTVAEDPHIRVFDEAQVSMLQAESGSRMDGELVGEKWLVKSPRVKIQARFENMGPELDSKIYSRAVALSGEILNDNVITVGSLEDSITWNGKNILDGQQSSFYIRDGPFFINATRGSSSLVQDPSQENLGVNIRLQSGVSLIVNREHHHTNVAIRMPQQAGGQEGLCGNFNGVGTDDTMEMMNVRFDPTVAPDDSLFAGISYN